MTGFDQYLTAPTADAVAELTRLGQVFDEEKDKLAAMKEAVTVQAERVETLERKTIPSLMRQCRQTELTTDDGRKIKINPTYTCKIREGKVDEALRWLACHGEAASIKYSVGRKFSMREHRKAQAMASRIRGQGIDPEVVKKIETSTLRKIWRLLCQDGKSMPEELFETSSFDKATVK